MIDYDLAKQLGDAGYDFSDSPTMYSDDVGCPTLAQLISACGTPFRELKQHLTAKKKWSASSARQRGGRQAFGTTPDEAVARLWLALHKK